MLFGKKPKRLLLTLSLCGASMPLLTPGLAYAADITLGIIGPHEYDLPVDYKPFNVLVQYGNGNASGNTYNSTGQRVPAHGGSHTWSGLTKYVHFRTFDALPHVGFAFEVIQSENYTLAGGTNYGGLGGPLWGLLRGLNPMHTALLVFRHSCKHLLARGILWPRGTGPIYRALFLIMNGSILALMAM